MPARPPGRGDSPSATPGKWLVTAAVSVGTLMGTIDASIVNVALPDIQASFGVTVTEATWISTAYLIAIVVILPLTGWLGSMVGRKRVYQAGLAVFTGASVLAGMAPSLPALIAARVLQGLGAGVLGPTEQAILRETFPVGEQGLASGLYGMVVLLGPTIGPLLGGWITDSYTWRWIFFINLPVGILAFSMVATILRDTPRMGAAQAGFDFVGIGLMAVGLSSLVIVLEQGNRWDWFQSPLVWGLSLASGSGLLLFVLWEFYGTRTPAVDLRILGNRALASAWVSIGVVGFGLVGGLLMQSLFLQQALGYTATQTGLQFFPRGLVTMIVTPAAGVLTAIVGPRPIVALGMVLAGWVMFLMSGWTLDAGPVQILFPMVVLGLALSLLIVPLFASGITAVEPRKATSAAGLMNLMFQLGGTFGTATLATLLERGTTLAHARLVERARPDSPAWTQVVQQFSTLAVVRGGVDATTGQQLALAALDRVITDQAAVISFEHVFQVAGLLFLASLLVMPFLPGRSRGTRTGTLSADL